MVTGAGRVADVLRQLTAGQVWTATALCAAGFTLLALVDWLTLRTALAPASEARISPQRSWVVSYISHALGQVMGFALVTGGAVRERYYRRTGVPVGVTATVAAVTSVSTWLGALALLGLSLLFGAPPGAIGDGPAVRAVMAVFCLAPALGYLLLALGARGTVRLGRFSLTVPAASTAACQVTLCILDWALAALVLRAVMPGPAIPVPLLASTFVVAQIAGTASTIPAGAGVFDAVIVGALAPVIGMVHAVSAVIAFRAIYYVLPAAVALAIVGADLLAPWQRAGRVLVRRGAALVRRCPSFPPALLAAGTFGAGAVLLGSAATPPVAGRMAALHAVSPTVLIQAAYLLSSLIGATLLLLARGVQRQVRAAYALAMPLLCFGLVVSLAKGLDYEEALLLAIVAAAMFRTRETFDRTSSLVAERFTRSWIGAIMLVLAATVWLALAASHRAGVLDLGMLGFSTRAAATRAILSTSVAAAACAMFGVARLLRVAQPQRAPADPASAARARDVISAARETTAHLALVGDKSLLFNERGDAFLMYAIAGQSWIAMGDPVGQHAERAALVRRFRDLAVQHGGRPVFYHVTPESLSLYVELGLTIRKIGECARVNLADFSLGGGGRKWLRRARRSAESAGCSFELLPQPAVAGVLPELRAVSDAWLATKRAREKGFSLGYFDEAYLRQCPVAVVRQGGRIVAFANVWQGGDAYEVSVDLMRFDPDGPEDVIDFLFGELLLWAKGQGFRWFDLGVAPLAGLDSAGAPLLWNRLGSLLFRKGTRGYDFEGLRRYKAKFAPEWSPRYIVGPGGLTIARAAADVAALIAATPASVRPVRRSPRHAPARPRRADRVA